MPHVFSIADISCLFTFLVPRILEFPFLCACLRYALCVCKQIKNVMLNAVVSHLVSDTVQCIMCTNRGSQSGLSASVSDFLLQLIPIREHCIDAQ